MWHKIPTYDTSAPSSLSVLVQHHVASFRIVDSFIFHLDHSLLLLDSPQTPLAGTVVHQLAFRCHLGPLVHVVGLETRWQGQRSRSRRLPTPQQRLHLRRFVTYVCFRQRYIRLVRRGIIKRDRYVKYVTKSNSSIQLFPFRDPIHPFGMFGFNARKRDRDLDEMKSGKPQETWEIFLASRPRLKKRMAMPIVGFASD